MQLHLVVPGLLLPAQVLHDCACDLDLPALGRLLGRGPRRWSPPLPLEDWLCREFGLATAPVAPLRLLGEGGDPGDQAWICADPAHLAFEQGRPILGESELEVDDAEMQALLAALRPRLAALPGFRDWRAGVPGSGLAYLSLAQLPGLITPPPSATRGGSAHLALPQGPQAREWTRLGNELQMLLHALPANRQREAARKPSINTLWFWGEGRLPEAAKAAPYAAIHADSELLKGLAHWSGARHAALPGTARELGGDSAQLVCLEQLAAPARSLDALAWREALLGLERDWFAPLAAAFFSGRLATLRLTALGMEAGFDLHLGTAERFRFWRKAQDLATLAP